MCRRRDEDKQIHVFEDLVKDLTEPQKARFLELANATMPGKHFTEEQLRSALTLIRELVLRGA
jgi:hypothetical protein